MAKPSSKSFLRLFIAAAIASPFLLLSSRMRPREDAGKVTNFAQEIMYPFEYAWHFTTTAVSNAWNHYFSLSHAAKENDEIKQQLTVLKTQVAEFEELKLETERLRLLLNLSKHAETKVSVSEVIGYPNQLPFQTMRIARGRADGVEVGFPIITADGVVGRIIRVGQKFSDAQLIIDSDFNLDVLIQRTRVRGVLRGSSDNSCRLLLHRKADIRIGDSVVTSGIVGSFPKGLPVGRVMRISYETDNVTQVITVEPWVDYRRTEEVVILHQGSSEIRQIMEAAGDQWLNETVGRIGDKAGG